MTVVILLSVLFIAGLLVGLTWLNYYYLYPRQTLSDFGSNWAAFRHVIFNNQIPYTSDLNALIRDEVSLLPPQPGELRFIYPVFSMLIFGLFSLVQQLQLAAALWTTVLQLCVLLTVHLSLRLFEWRFELLPTVLIYLFSLTFFFVIQPVLKGDVIIILTMLLVLALLMLKNGNEESAGILLSFLVIKPTVFIFPLLLIFLWLIGMGRWRMLAWFGGMIAIYLTAGFIFSPSWLLDYIRTIVWFRAQHPLGNLIEALAALFPTFGFRLGWVLSVFFILALVVEWFAVRNRSFGRVLWLVALNLVVGQLVNYYNDYGNYFVLLPVLIFIASTLAKRWRVGGKVIAALFLILISAVSWYIALRAPAFMLFTQPSMLLYVVPPLITLPALYWIRWWVSEPDVWLNTFTPYPQS